MLAQRLLGIMLAHGEVCDVLSAFYFISFELFRMLSPPEEMLFPHFAPLPHHPQTSARVELQRQAKGQRRALFICGRLAHKFIEIHPGMRSMKLGKGALSICSRVKEVLERAQISVRRTFSSAQYASLSAKAPLEGGRSQYQSLKLGPRLQMQSSRFESFHVKVSNGTAFCFAQRRLPASVLAQIKRDAKGVQGRRERLPNNFKLQLTSYNIIYIVHIYSLCSLYIVPQKFNSVLCLAFKGPRP